MNSDLSKIGIAAAIAGIILILESMYFVLFKGGFESISAVIIMLVPGIITLSILTRYPKKPVEIGSLIVLIFLIVLPIALSGGMDPFLGQGETGNVNQEGTGTASSADKAPLQNVSYEISTCKELQNIQYDLNGSYELTQDIDCSETKNWNNGKGFKPIQNFTGSFNGQSHVIKNLYINRGNTNYVGLFGSTDGATIKNVGLKKVDITGRFKVGGLVGYNEGIVSNSHVSGSVTGSDDYVGGLIGLNEDNVSDSYSTGSVDGSGDNIGGLIGHNSFGGSVSDSYATSSVTGSGDYVGGLIGLNSDNVSNSYATGKVIGSDNYAGGLIGDNDIGSVSNSFWDTETSGVKESDWSWGTGLSTSEMKSKSTFLEAGWDFEETWYMSGYPHLQWEK